jgi:hypothetical protein
LFPENVGKSGGVGVGEAAWAPVTMLKSVHHLSYCNAYRLSKHGFQEGVFFGYLVVE